MLGINFIKQEVKNLTTHEVLEKYDQIKMKALTQIDNLIGFFKTLNKDNRIYIARIPAVPKLYYLQDQIEESSSHEHSNKNVKVIIQQINLAIDYLNKDANFKGDLNADWIAITSNQTGETYDLQAFQEYITLEKCHYTAQYEKKIQ